MLKVNGKEIDFKADTTISDLLEQQGFPVNRVAVERNGEIVPRKMLSLTLVEDHDVLEVVSFVGGG
ncbi:sulfur carrier protein ThiS [Eubacterium sp. am_0171]|uniref:sulfur carrier protein ThiS n=1 Tax=Clostridia TaxID=186801 RepID=UPI00067ED345|nr:MULTISPECIES: sulfur carrier protein ThiS [Clostridia]MBS6763082.1 sulfur carrier protein ThiS [Clostridium sp.]MSC82335.1 sulfur carrier protein ThiS [Eubacterium sp. BIOML-A1]MSD04705.1 sulfur carrier protein ThiS [Eubacterium sp. BIOML-A2]RYT25530.1 sulfur carrier protein ThiS [Eubacterium sp. am_0171]